MTLLVDFQRLDTESGFDHNLLWEQDQHITHTAIRILTTLSNIREPILITYQGVMGAGKTSVTKLLNNELLKQNKNTLIVRLEDNRAGEGDIFDRNGLELTESTQVITFSFGTGKEVIETALLNNPSIGEGSVVFISEAQFMGNIMEIEGTIEMLLQRGITVICDCLSHYYNGKPIDTSTYIRNKSYVDFKMWPCDSLDEFEKGNIPMRVVRINASGDMPDALDRETAHYYMSLSVEERISIFNAIKNSPYAHKLIREENGEIVYLVPSHPTLDADFVPGGNERYIPTSLSTCINILESAGLNGIADKYKETAQLEL